MSSSSNTDHEAEFIRANLYIVVGATVIGGILGLINSPSTPISGFITGSIGLGFLVGIIAVALIAKETGGSKGQQQQQQVGSDSEPTIICPECGWKNPKSNQYCNDCGYEFSEQSHN
jgi:hypothetical protein